MEVYSVVLTAFSCLIALASVLIMINNNKKNHKLIEESNKKQLALSERANDLQAENNRIQASEKFLEWHEIDKYINALIQQMEDNNFHPDCIYAPFRRDSFMASMIGNKLKENVPIFVGLLFHSQDTKPGRKGFSATYLVSRRIRKAHISFQDLLPIESTDKLLIIRDYSSSGVCFDTVIKHFMDTYRLNPENVKTSCIAFKSGGRYDNPDYYCLEVDHDMWFPWGKSY